jgi:acyl carrier protein
MPLTPNGKLDRKALPGPDSSRPQLDVAYAAARTAIEEKLVEIWEEILDVCPIGIHDNFFDLGGHSLAGASLLSRLNRIFGLDLAVRVLFEAPTVAQLMGFIGSSLPSLGKGEQFPRVICILALLCSHYKISLY